MGLPGIHGAGEVWQWTGEMLDSWLDITFSATLVLVDTVDRLVGSVTSLRCSFIVLFL